MYLMQKIIFLKGIDYDITFAAMDYYHYYRIIIDDVLTLQVHICFETR